MQILGTVVYLNIICAPKNATIPPVDKKKLIIRLNMFLILLL